MVVPIQASMLYPSYRQPGKDVLESTQGLCQALGGVPSRPPPRNCTQAKRGGQPCSLSPLGLITSAFKKNPSRNLTASKTGTWARSCQCCVYGSNSLCHHLPRSQPGSLLLPEELGNPSKKRCRAISLFAPAIADNSTSGHSLSRSQGHDPAQEEQEQSLAKGGVAEPHRPQA